MVLPDLKSAGSHEPLDGLGKGALFLGQKLFFLLKHDKEMEEMPYDLHA